LSNSLLAIMKIFWLALFLHSSIIFHATGQEKPKAKMPLFVSHVGKENAAVTRRKEAPRHFFLTRVICFRKKCRAFIGWRTQQRSMRYDYKKASRFRNGKKPASTDSIIVQQDKPIKKIPMKETVRPLPAPPAKSDSIIVLSEVLFETNSYKLNKELLPKLDSIAAYLKKQLRAEVTIFGHTDNVGKESYNLNLSSQRAEAVAEYFLDKGIAPEQVSFAGFGSVQPIATNETPEGRRKNRRVEIRIHGKN
jgi:outer membrane protein OmpA-like peptidoglycan-associated protein